MERGACFWAWAHSGLVEILTTKSACQRSIMNQKLPFQKDCLPQECVSSNLSPFLCSLCISGDSIWSESCTDKGIAGSMDLNEKWPLEEGSWLSHAGIHHFPNTRGGMASFDVPDTWDPLSPCISLSQPSCSRCLPSMVVFSKAARWMRSTQTLK